MKPDGREPGRPAQPIADPRAGTSGNYRRASSGRMQAVAQSSSAMRAATKVVPDVFDSNAAGCRCLLRMLCSPGSDSLEFTHRFLTDYLGMRFRPQIAERLGVAGYELMSNALKFSSMSEEVAFEIFDLPDSAAVRFENDTIAARISMLQDHMQKIQANAEATMLAEMKRSVAGGSVRPMLGLARVVHEAGMQLDILIQERRVTVTASCRK